MQCHQNALTHVPARAPTHSTCPSPQVSCPVIPQEAAVLRWVLGSVGDCQRAQAAPKGGRAPHGQGQGIKQRVAACRKRERERGQRGEGMASTLGERWIGDWQKCRWVGGRMHSMP